MTTNEKLDLVLAKLETLEVRLALLESKLNQPMTPSYPGYPTVTYPWTSIGDTIHG